MNRVMTGHLADLHFAPTQAAAANLSKEGITAPVHIVGNSVIDALMMGIERLEGKNGLKLQGQFEGLRLDRPYVLITGHRRESFGRPFEEICLAIADAAEKFPGVDFVYPVHLNPNVQDPVRRLLGDRSNVRLLPPVEYPAFLLLMKNCFLVLTDSGGIQEEAPSLGKPVLVMREVTERTEGVEAGTARLVGVRREDIFRHLSELLTDVSAYDRMAKAVNPYGDGQTSARIVRIVSGFFNATNANIS
jgi:UDP-N-acetylglucosamine 2-epimerase (non-hydrolysing)